MAKRSYTRRSFKGRTYRSGRSYAGKSLFTFAKALAKPGAKLATKYMKKALGLNTETHWLDTADTNVATSSTWSAISNPMVIPVGDSVNTRSGNSLRGTSYQIIGRVQANTAATAGCLVRVVVVYYPTVQGSTITNNGVFDSNGRFTSAFQMGDYAEGNYSVLYDKKMTIEVSGQGKDTAMFQFNWRPLDWHIRFTASDTTGSLSNLINGQVRAFIITTEAGANTPNYWCDQRVKFVDN